MNRLRAMEDSDLRASALVASVAALVTLAAVASTAGAGLVQPRIALAFFAFIAVGELVRITLPGGREAAPLSAAGGLAYAFLGDVPSGAGALSGTTHSVLQVVAVTAAGMLVGAVPHAAVGRPPRIDYVARRVLAVLFAALLFRPAYLAGLFAGVESTGWLLALLMIGLFALSAAIDAMFGAVVRAGRTGAPFGAALRDELQALVGIGSAIGATGLLIALAAIVMGLWAIPVFCVPLLLTQFSFRRYAAIRATYLQTIRSLSRVTELGGYTETGHTRRVSQLSVAVGQDIGMGESDLLQLEYASLMHDIGQLSLTDPIPGGATVVADPLEQRRIADLGASVIRQTGVLGEVASIVERQTEPYRRPHEQIDDAVPLASRIIKAVNAYDDLVSGSLETDRRLEALERLRLGMAYEYDPRVVESLSRVIDRSTRLGA